MNERIQELAVKAKIEFTYDPTEKPIRAFAECWEDELEKFAELIVQECAYVADRAVAEDMGWDIGGIIKEHFGVEEPKGWVCNKCGTDRTKSVCPYGHTAALTGECPMVGVAQ